MQFLIPPTRLDKPNLPALQWEKALLEGLALPLAHKAYEPMAEDFYSTLGVRRDASAAEIQKAYRELARKYHPDLHPDDKDATKKFQQVQAAFDVLNDPEKREMFDRYGSSFNAPGAGGPKGRAAWNYGPQEGAPDIDFGADPFSQVFGEHGPGGGPANLGDIFRHFQQASAAKSRKGAGAGARRGADLTAEMDIPFATSISGGELQLNLQRQPGQTETINVKIPPGIQEGKKIRLRGQGEPGPRGGTPGDLLISIRVTPHPFYHRQGNHLLVKVPVTLREAALGSKIDVPTPSGTVSLKVPPGTSSGARLRVKGHGITPKEGPAGDLLAEIQIVLPKELSEADRQLIGQIDERYPQNPRAGLRW